MENKKMQAQGKYILGLDIGPNSIGWAVLDCITEGGQPRPAALRDLNSYIFLSGVDEAGKPRNAERREKRLAGRQIWRRAKRRQVLAEKLKECGLLPEKWQTGKSAENTEIANGIDKQFAAREKPPDDNRQWANPFAMRAFALDYALTPHELGRVILHLQKHRGYFSNRGAKYLPLLKHLELNDRKIRREETGEEDARRGEKAETGEKEKRLVLGGIGELEKILGDGEYRALGEYLWKNPKRAAVRITRLWTERKIEKGKKAGETERVYFYAAREMVEVEFDKLRKTQKAHTKIGGEVWDEIRNILFEQYPVQNPPPKKLLKKKPGDLRTFRQDNLRYNAVGDCGVVPDKKRAAAARLESQEFRTRAVIANIEADGEKLDCRLRQKLYSSSAASTAKLNQSGRLSWTEAGKILGGKKITNYGQDEDGKNGLVANRTGRAVCEITGEEIWRKMGCNEYLADGNAMQKTIAACKKQNRTQQYALVEDLLSYTCKLGLYQRLTKHWQFAPGAGGGAYNLAVLELESGYMKYSAAAINRMLKYMRPKSESGEGEMLDEYEACEKIKEKIKPRGGKKDGGAPDKLPLIKQEDLPDTANPRVERGLYAVRRIVNALVKKHGAPAQIRLEMARDLKNSKKHRAEIERRQKQNSKNNENAEREMREMPEFAGGARIYPKDRERYKIWIYEQGKKCVYCGGDIANPFGAEIDHIYPRASFSQNFGNIVVACQNCNQTKGKQTPWEAFSGNREKWRGIELRLAPRKQIKKKNGEPEENGEPAMKLSAAKRKRILSRIKTAELKSAEELTNRALNDTQYLITAAAESLRGVAPVRAGAGQATAQLRRVWDLDKILPREDETMRGKNRGDQRHHAVDAFVVALTEPGILRELVKINQKEQDGEFSEDEKENARLAEDARRNIAPPKSWAGGKTAAAVKEKIMEKTVPYQKSPRIRGALHKDSFYGESVYDCGVLAQIPSAAKTAESLRPLPEKKKMLRAEPAHEYFAAENWAAAEEWQKRRGENPKTPLPEELKKIRVWRRCYTVRKPLENNAVLIKTAFGEWTPGVSGYWIASKQTHELLRAWLAEKGLTEKSKESDIKEALKDNPPKMPNGNSLYSVRAATVKKSPSVRRVHGFHAVELQNNSHAEVFRRKKAGDWECRARVVAAIDAAMRRRRKEPILDKSPSAGWGGGWEWAFSLSINEMVRFDPEKMEGGKGEIIRAHGEFGAPVYRVQMLEQRQVYTFRHFSVSGVRDGGGKDSPRGKLQVGNANLRGISKIRLGVLGE